MAILTHIPSEIINPRNWNEFTELRTKVITAYRNKDFNKFDKEIEKIRKISRGKLLTALNKLKNQNDGEHKNINLLKELTLDMAELQAILKN